MIHRQTLLLIISAEILTTKDYIDDASPSSFFAVQSSYILL